MIYLDNAATSFYRPPEVAAAVVHAMETVGNSARGVHSVSLAADRTVYAAREAVSALFWRGGAGADGVCRQRYPEPEYRHKGASGARRPGGIHGSGTQQRSASPL